MAEAIDKACGGTFIKDAVAKLSTLTEPGVLSEESVYLRPQEKKALTIIVRSFNSSDNGSDDIMDSRKQKAEPLGRRHLSRGQTKTMLLSLTEFKSLPLRDPPTTGLRLYIPVLLLKMFSPKPHAPPVVRTATVVSTQAR